MDSKLKIICTGYQRTGTKSLGDFIQQFTTNRATWKHSDRNTWTQKVLLGDFLSLINSEDFKENTIFEDSPFHNLSFIKFYYQYNELSYFVNIERNPESWFDSMVRHSEGATLGSGLWFLYNYGLFDELLLLNRGISFNDLHQTKFDITILKTRLIEKFKIDTSEKRLFFDIVDPNRERSIFINHDNNDSWDQISEFLINKVGLKPIKNPQIFHRHLGKRSVGEIIKSKHGY